ncbi:MAG: AAA family ATPase [Deltaproteobacteria bacterium]|nr:AAA family ATPase [Deltaproteobacteria bacterium]
MRLAGLHIDGFGIFHNLDITGLSPGLNVFLGENESGKTTLLAFLRIILFGFPPGQRRENIYPPLAGGRHGGYLNLLSGDKEEYVVSRYHGSKRGPLTVALPDGSQGDAEVVRQLTGAATEDLFRTVFAFSLEELQRFESLKKQEVKAAIYSAGAGVGKTSIAQVEKGLEASIGRLYKPGGKNPTINTLFRELQEIDRTIGEKVAEIDRYDELRHELDQVAAQIDLMKDRLGTKRRRLERVKLLEAAWEDWINLCRVREELAELPKIEVFPADGISRLEKLQEGKRLLNNHKVGLVHKIEQSEKQLGSIEVQQKWLDAAEDVRLLNRGLDRFSASRQELTELQPRLEQEKESLAKELNALGPNWNLEILSNFDASISAREEIHRNQERLTQVRDVQRQAERSMAHAKSALEQAKARAGEAEKAAKQIPEPKEKDPRVLLERRRSLRSLRNLILSGQELQNDLEGLKERQEDLQEQEDRLHQQLEAIRTVPLWPTGFAGFASVVAGMVIGWYWGVAAGLTIAFVVLLISLALAWSTLQQRRQQEVQAELLMQQLEQVLEKLNSLNGEETQCSEQISSSVQEVERQAAAIGIAGHVTLEGVDRAEADVEVEQETLHRWQPASQRYHESKEDLERRQKELDEAEKNSAEALKKFQDLEKQWQGWLRQAGLAENLSPHGALEIMERIRTLRQQAGSQAQLEERFQLLEISVKDYEKNAEVIAEKVEARDLLREDADTVVYRLVEGLERAEEAQRKYDMLQRQLEDYQAEKKQKEDELQQLEKELENLYREGDAEGEDQFRQRAHLYELRLRTKEALERHQSSLENLGGRGDDQDRFQEELQQCSPDRLHGERDELAEEVQNLEKELSSLQESHGRLNERKEQLESAEELSHLREQRNVLMAELTDAARRWSALTMCLRFLQKGRQIYEKERKQPVVKESEHFFRAITNGRYQTIVAPQGEERIQVIGANDNRYELDMLSRGTAEQLYLSLRFGYIQEFGRRARPLPVVMDDILVNFDPQRVRAAISTMLELASKNQILFFTCHPETVSLFKKLDKNIPVWELKGGECGKA